MRARRRVVLFLAVVSWILPGVLAAQPARGALPAMVVLVRHAEKAAEPAGDPALDPQGVERARALAACLEHSGVTAIVTTELRRTKDTAAPLAAALHVTPEVVPVEKADTSEHAAAVARAVARHAGGVVLVVGHSNTVPAIIAALGGPRVAPICEEGYDNLFVMVRVRGAWRLAHARYGAPSRPCQ